MDHLTRQYRRLIIAGLDLTHSLRCVRELLARVPLPPVETNGVVYALNLAAVISYSRAFTANKTGTSRPTTACLPSSVLKIYDPAEHAIHSNVLARRDREFAHSDADALEVQFTILPGGGEAGSVRQTQQVFNHPTLRQFELMIVRMLAAIDERKRDLASKLGPGTHS